MNKILLVLMTMLYISCTSNSKDVASKDAGCTETSCPTPKMQVFSAPIVDTVGRDNWQFSLSGEGWTLIDPVQGDVVAAFSNEKMDARVFLIKEKTNKNYSEYVFFTLESIKAGTTKITSVKQNDRDDMYFTLITAVGMDDTKVVSGWVGVRSGYGYVFGCIVPQDADADTDTTNICNQMFNSLQIK